MTDDKSRAKIEAVNEPDTQTPPERNLASKLKHRREVLWQITVPFVICVLVFLIMAVLAGATTLPQASKLADISMIWLITPTYIFALLMLVILVALTYAIIRLIMVLPFYAFRLHTMIKLVGSRLQGMGNAAVEPFLRIHVFVASIQSFGSNLRGGSRGPSSEMQEITEEQTKQV